MNYWSLYSNNITVCSFIYLTSSYDLLSTAYILKLISSSYQAYEICIVLLLYKFYSWENWGTESLNNLPKVIMSDLLRVHVFN